MQEPTNSDPAPPIDAVIEVSQSAIVFEEIDSPVIAQSQGNAEPPLADEPLNRVERIAADFGAWIITFVERWHLESSPSFAVDDHPISDLLDPTASPTEDSHGPPTH